jgi:hypothetical protein
MRLIRRLSLLVIVIALALTALLAGLWGSLALYFRAPLPEVGRLVAGGLWALLMLFVVAGLLSRRRRRAVLVLAVAVAGMALWWSTIRPSNDRVWNPDVARIAQARIEGDTLTVNNVRDFTWRSDTDFDERWETRSYDLTKLTGADLFLSYWAGEAIAHAIVSFQFSDAPPLAFSIEIRKEKGEDYSAIAGFFKSYEVAFIAADERDVVKVRATVRGEDVRLYRLDIRPETARKLLEMYVVTANRLVEKPRWYNTLTTNCTTVIFRMSRVLDPGIPRDWRVLFSGYVPGYLYDNDFLSRAVPLDELVRLSHIRDRAPGPADDPGFSARIRQGVPKP